MSVKSFEDQRWVSQDQPVEFWHKQALSAITSGPVLDVGCGVGLLLELLKSKNIKAIGVDVSSSGLKKSVEKGLDVREHDIEHEPLPFENNLFAHVTCLEVMEHLHHPEQVLKECVRVSNGGVSVSVPNFNSISARIQVLLGKRPENNSPQKGHIFWFNKSILEKMIKSSNVEIVLFSGLGYWSKKNSFQRMIGQWLADVCPSLFALSFFVTLKKRILVQK